MVLANSNIVLLFLIFKVCDLLYSLLCWALKSKLQFKQVMSNIQQHIMTYNKTKLLVNIIWIRVREIRKLSHSLSL